MIESVQMTLSAKQLAQLKRRRERLLEICCALPEVNYEIVGDEHLAFRVRKKTLLTTFVTIMATYYCFLLQIEC